MLVQGLMIDEWAEVSKADPSLSNIYGGAVRIALNWSDGDSSSKQTLDLDTEGANALAAALLRLVGESANDYKETHAGS